MKKTVLIIDDSLYMRTLIKAKLTDEGYEVIAEAATGNAAIELALEHEPDLITLDNILPDMKGIDVIKVLHDEGLKARTIVISAVGQKLVIDRMINAGALEYLVKPFTPEQLIAAVTKVMHQEYAA